MSLILKDLAISSFVMLPCTYFINIIIIMMMMMMMMMMMIIYSLVSEVKAPIESRYAL